MSRVRILTGAIYQNKLQPIFIPRLCPAGAAREGDFLIISEMTTFPHQLKLLGVTGQCRVTNIMVSGGARIVDMVFKVSDTILKHENLSRKYRPKFLN
jgi:hypothetical protein